MLLLSFAISISAIAQDDKTVTLIVAGEGKTKQEATNESFVKCY